MTRQRTVETLKGLYPALRIASESSVFKEDGEPSEYVTQFDVELIVSEYTDLTDAPDKKVAGRLIAYAVNYYEALDHGVSIFDVMDSHSQDVADFLDLYSDDEWSAAVRHALDDNIIGQDLLILDRVTIEQPFRGIGLGLVAVQELIRAWGRDGIVALKPFPLQFSGFEDRAWIPPPELQGKSRAEIRGAAKNATQKLASYWKRLGLVRVSRTSLYILNTAFREPSVEQMLGQTPEPEPVQVADLTNMQPASGKPQ